jgi:hypothetical protein
MEDKVSIRWGQGFSRLSRAVLGVSWAIFLVVQLVDFKATEFGTNFGYMVIFSLVYMAVHALVSWIAKGFMGGSERQQ